jgi:hypothetical protein
MKQIETYVYRTTNICSYSAQYVWRKVSVFNYINCYLSVSLWLIIGLFLHRQYTQYFKNNMSIYYSIFSLLAVSKP